MGSKRRGTRIPVNVRGVEPFTVILGGWLANVITHIAGHKMQTWGRRVFVRGGCSPDAKGIAHEAMHVEQWVDAPIGFPLGYVWQQLAVGYERNRFERAARKYADVNAWRFARWAEGYRV